MEPGKEEGREGDGIEERRPDGMEMEGMRGVQRGRVRNRTAISLAMMRKD